MPMDEFAEAFGMPVPAAAETSPVNLTTTIARHPDLFRRWLPFGLQLMRGMLPPRDRELLILRTAVRCDSEYEWGQHRLIARECGLSEVEIDRVRAGPDEAWGTGDRLLLAVADEIYETDGLADPTWEALRARFDDGQLVELLMLLGHYRMVAVVAKALQIEPEGPRGAT
jgi:alkylhydroperoxidase family enzyme